MDYAARLAQLQQEGLPFPAGSDAEREALARFARFFGDFSPGKIDVLLDQTYAANVWFNDTLKTIEGRDALKPYLRHSAEAVEHCSVDVHETLGNGRGDYFLRWTMTIRFKRFKKGQDTRSIGMSHLRFDRDGRVVLHQDYWDSTQGLFEHVPVLGWMIGKIKGRL